jgi:hypothetical protein
MQKIEKISNVTKVDFTEKKNIEQLIGASGPGCAKSNNTSSIMLSPSCTCAPGMSLQPLVPQTNPMIGQYRCLPTPPEIQQ